MPKKRFKGPAVRALDAWYSTGSVEDNLREARVLLESRRGFKSLVGDLKTRGRGRDEFDDYPKGNSHLGPDFENVARRCYLDAIDRASGHNPPVPIRTTWETGDGISNLECDFTDRGDHVEVTIRVPGVQMDAAAEQRHHLTDVRTE
jgi:hypothetical protein